MVAFKHFTLSDRRAIEQGLRDGRSFSAIAKDLCCDPTGVAKEVKRHVTIRETGAYGRRFNDCALRMDCGYKLLCGEVTAKCAGQYCRFCGQCTRVCPDYKKEECPVLSKPPHVCNGCDCLRRCTLTKRLYNADAANDNYTALLSSARSSIAIDEASLQRLDGIVSPLILRGQSIHHICASNADSVMCSERTIYNYVNARALGAANIDLPRKVRFRPRRGRRGSGFKVDKACRIGRGYEDFRVFMEEDGTPPVVEMDSVEGTKGGKALLTICFTDSMLMLACLRDANTSQSVIDVFEMLYSRLGASVFSMLFQVVLTDNGSEFSNPAAIEFDGMGNRRTRIFYCDPSSPYQKGSVENNHELIRRIIPKKNSFDRLSQEDVDLMMNHINSYGRRKLNDKSPYEMFSFLHGAKLLTQLGVGRVEANEICLKPALLCSKAGK